MESRAAVRVMLAELQAAQQREAQGAEVQNAVRDTYTWVTEHTKTFNEHWKYRKIKISCSACESCWAEKQVRPSVA